MTTSTEIRPLAVVTGAASGIGPATAVRLAADGFHVLVGVRRPADGDDIREQKARLGKLSGDDITAGELAGDPITAKYTIGRDGALFTAASRMLPDRVLDGMLRGQNARLAA